MKSDDKKEIGNSYDYYVSFVISNLETSIKGNVFQNNSMKEFWK